MSIINDFKNEFRFSADGRTSRRNFWIYQITMWVSVLAVAFVCGLLSVVMGDSTGVAAAVLASLFALVLGIANIFVTIRRLHDMGYSGYWYFAVLAAGVFASVLDHVAPGVSLVVMVIVYVCLSQKSQPGLNKYDVTE